MSANVSVEPYILNGDELVCVTVQSEKWVSSFFMDPAQAVVVAKHIEETGMSLLPSKTEH